MKTLMCSLTAILTLALSGAVFAEEITGTVISVNHKQGRMVLDAGKHDVRGKLEIILVGDLKAPKVGEKVRVHCWYHNRGRYCTDKIEKLGNTDGGSKKK